MTDSPPPVLFLIQLYLKGHVKKGDLDSMIHYVKAEKSSAYGSLTKEQVDGDAGELVELMKKKGHISDVNNDYTFLIKCLKAVQLGEAANYVQKLVDDKKAEQTTHHSETQSGKKKRKKKEKPESVQSEDPHVDKEKMKSSNSSSRQELSGSTEEKEGTRDSTKKSKREKRSKKKKRRRRKSLSRRTQKILSF